MYSSEIIFSEALLNVTYYFMGFEEKKKIIKKDC